MAWFALAAQAASAVTGAVGGLQSAWASSQAAKYNAAVAERNAKIASQNAVMAAEAGSIQAFNQGLKSRAEMGGIKTGEAASGVNVSTGSAVQTQISAEELGNLDAKTIRSMATKEAYGYQTQAQNFKSEAALDRYQASQDLESGWISAGGTLLGGAGTTGNTYAQFQHSGALGG